MVVDERWRALGKASEFMNLEGIEFREYQFSIINSVIRHGNTIVVLPTGLGKTIIGTAIIAHALVEGKKAIFLAPTKPLAEQHYTNLKKLINLTEDELLLLTGSLEKSRRETYQQLSKVIVATPQTVANDLKNAVLSLDNFGVVVFDECHRAVGRYAYTYIANECEIRGIKMLGLTASPGSKKEKINALVKTLNIKHIETRVSTDSDVVKYVMPNNVHVVNVDLSPRIKEISALLKPEIQVNLDTLHKIGLFHFNNFENIPKGRLIELGNQISRISAPNYKFAAMFSYSKLLNLVHAYDLLVIEGLYPFSKYMEALYERPEKSRALENLLKNSSIIAAREAARQAVKNGEEHPKIFAVLDIIKDYKGRHVMLFAQYRSTIKMIVEFLNNNGFTSRAFVGKKDGITQEQQKQTIDDFRKGDFQVLVASSIGEEGIDIPGVDLVIFDEPIPNEIRNIQRRGRTARFAAGDVYILVANGTKDQIYLYISRQREEKMAQLIKSVNKTLEGSVKKEDPGQTQL